MIFCENLNFSCHPTGFTLVGQSSTVRVLNISYPVPQGFVTNYSRSLISPIPFPLIKYTISELPFASVSKRVRLQKFKYETEFDLDENELVSKTHFHMKGFTSRLIWKQNQIAYNIPSYLFIPDSLFQAFG